MTWALIAVLLVALLGAFGRRVYQIHNPPVCEEWTHGTLRAVHQCAEWGDSECEKWDDLMESDSSCVRWRP